MNELIKITEHDGRKAVSARELYDKLGFKDNNFTKFCGRYITKNEYAVQGVDYEHLVLLDDMPNGGFREIKNFVLSVDFAKKICMLARTEQGDKIRQYFIDVEKKYQSAVKALEPEDMLLQSVQLMIEQKKRIAAVENRVSVLEAQTKTTPDYFTIVGYGSLRGVNVNISLAQRLGKAASRMCNDLGFTRGMIPDPRFGMVYTYPKMVLEQVFPVSL